MIRCASRLKCVDPGIRWHLAGGVTFGCARKTPAIRWDVSKFAPPLAPWHDEPLPLSTNPLPSH